MVAMAAKSPSEAIAKPASRMSTPRSSRAWAMLSFSWVVMLQPGDCSPSRRVVSKIRTRLLSVGIEDPMGKFSCLRQFLRFGSYNAKLLLFGISLACLMLTIGGKTLGIAPVGDFSGSRGGAKFFSCGYTAASDAACDQPGDS